MSMDTQVKIRVADAELRQLDRLCEQLQQVFPGQRVSRSSAIRYLIVSSGGVAPSVPTTLAAPDPVVHSDRATKP